MNLDNPHSLLSLALCDSEGGKVKVYGVFSFTVNSVTVEVLSWHLGIRRLKPTNKKKSAKSSLSSLYHSLFPCLSLSDGDFPPLGPH